MRDYCRFAILAAAAALSLLRTAPVAAEQPAATGGRASVEQACRSYRFPVTVENRTVEAKAEACPQADGSVRIIQDTPGLPTQTYVVPPNDAAGSGLVSIWAYDPWLDWPPFWLNPPLLLVIGLPHRPHHHPPERIFHGHPTPPPPVHRHG